MKRTTNSIFMVLLFNFLLFIVSFEITSFKDLRILLIFVTFAYSFFIWIYESFFDRARKIKKYTMTNVYLMFAFEAFILAVSFLTDTIDEFRGIVIGVPLTFFILSWFIDKDIHKSRGVR